MQRGVGAQKGIGCIFLSSLHLNVRRGVACSCRDLRFFPMIQNTSYAAEGHGSLLVLALLALVVGAAARLVGAIFRLTLEQADRLRDSLIAWAHGEKLLGFLFVVATCATAALIAAWLVRRFSPHVSGSGIPQVEAMLNEEVPQAPFHLIWVKFCGGVLAIGSGLALGREGPSVQMGASVAHLVGKAFRREWPDCRVLLAAGAGAGLATAFNAPMAGAVFVRGGSSSVSRSRRSVHRRRASRWRACFLVMRRISMSMRLPIPAPKRDRSFSCWELWPVWRQPRARQLVWRPYPGRAVVG